jgi:hypothetical protein
VPDIPIRCADTYLDNPLVLELGLVSYRFSLDTQEDVCLRE